MRAAPRHGDLQLTTKWRGWALAAIVFLGVSLGIGAYVRLPAPVTEIGDAVGLQLLPPGSENCQSVGARRVIAPFRTREVTCTWQRASSPTRIHELAEFTYDVWTRRVRRAERSWRSRDELVWRHELDSARATLRHRGGTQCFDRPQPFGAGSAATDRSAAAPSRAEIWEYWRFPTFLVNLSGGEVDRSDGENGAWRWALFVRATPRRKGVCT
jgi:hypothetical protein